MSDIGLFIIGECINLDFQAGDWVGDDGLETAVIISLFTDQRVSEAEVPDGQEDSAHPRRGWWGDMFADEQGDQIGSKLWLVDRSKITNTVLGDIEVKAANALDWMLRDGVAKAVDIAAEADADNREQVNIAIVITKPDNSTNKFGFQWNKQEIKRAA